MSEITRKETTSMLGLKKVVYVKEFVTDVSWNGENITKIQESRTVWFMGVPFVCDVRTRKPCLADSMKAIVSGT